MNILSQSKTIEDKEFRYDCSINEDDLVCFTFSEIENNNSRIVDFITIDFPTLREFMESDKKEYISEKYFIKDISKENILGDYYWIQSRESLDRDIMNVPIIFLCDSYQILKKMWVDDEEY